MESSLPDMQLYVCYGTWNNPPVPGRPHGHACGWAHSRLRAAGHNPEVVKSYGLGPLPDWANLTSGRREVRRLTGNSWVPLLVLDDGSWIQGAENIVEWAGKNPGPAI